MRNPVNTQDLVAWYTEHHLTMEEIGRLVGMSKQGVMKRLHKAGITIQYGTHITQPCAYCGVPVTRLRCHAKRGTRMYCCPEHYYADRENPNYQQWRQGGRLARAVVAQHYPLSPVEVVHHKDGNQRNNDLANLAVYASQADHLAAHHGRTIEPAWDGAC